MISTPILVGLAFVASQDPSSQEGARSALTPEGAPVQAQGQAHCPLCVAGGYGIANADASKRWLLNTVYAPSTETEAETFLWYRVSPRWSTGLGYLHRQGAFRLMNTYQLAPEKGGRPAVYAMAGVQGIGTGNPGVSLTAEKNWGRLNLFAGVGYRTNRRDVRLLGGLKWSPGGQTTLGLQSDGLMAYPFVTHPFGPVTLGLYLLDFQSPAVLVGTRF